MEIKDLKPKQGDVEITAEVIEKSPVRNIDKPGFKGRVCNALIKDNSGSISLTLWNEEIDKVGIGDKIKISKGYVNEWQGEIQLSAGKFGKIEVLEKGTGKKEEPEQEIKTNFELDDDKNRGFKSGDEYSDEDQEDVDVEEEFF